MNVAVVVRCQRPSGTGACVTKPCGAGGRLRGEIRWRRTGHAGWRTQQRDGRTRASRATAAGKASVIAVDQASCDRKGRAGGRGDRGSRLARPGEGTGKNRVDGDRTRTAGRAPRPRRGRRCRVAHQGDRGAALRRSVRSARVVPGRGWPLPSVRSRGPCELPSAPKTTASSVRQALPRAGSDLALGENSLQRRRQASGTGIDRKTQRR